MNWQFGDFMKALFFLKYELYLQDCEKAQCLKIKCQVGRLERGQSAILFIYSRLAVSTILQVSGFNHTQTWCSCNVL